MICIKEADSMSAFWSVQLFNRVESLIALGRPVSQDPFLDGFFYS
jgi:hypothetical protein